MAKDFGTIGNPEQRYLPPVGRSHPKDGGMIHHRTTTYTKVGKNGSTRSITLRGEAGDDRPCTSWGLTNPHVIDEEIRKRRETLVKSRSKTAGHSSSSRTQRFIPTNRDIDRQIDSLPISPEYNHNPGPREWKPARQPKRSTLRSLAHR